MRLRVVIETDAEKSRRLVQERLAMHSVAATGTSKYYELSILLKDDNDIIMGGLFGSLWGDWLHIETLWVDELVRGQGYGRRMMAMAERYAVERGFKNAHLSTYSFQARPMYEKIGYQVFGTLEDYPPGHSKYYMRKRLV